MQNIHPPVVSSQIFSKMLRWQTSVTLITAGLAFLVAGQHAALSALLGGVAVIIGAYLGAKIARRSESTTQASAVLINLLKAEAVKILVIFLLLFLSFKLYEQLVPLALIVGLAAAALISGAAMAKLKASEIKI